MKVRIKRFIKIRKTAFRIGSFIEKKLGPKELAIFGMEKKFGL